MPTPNHLRSDAEERITIVRDTWGTPHVYADTRRALFHGYGYSVAVDRLFQLDMARRSATGRVAEVLGAQHFEQDRAQRVCVDSESVRAQYESLPTHDRDVVDGYADGVNARIREVVSASDTLLPRQYRTHDFTPTPWTGFDVVMLFVGTMAVRYSDTTTQADNLALLRALTDHFGPDKALELFDQLVWRDDPRAPTTIPPECGSVPLTEINPLRQAEQAALPLPPDAPPGTCDPTARPPVRFSNAWLVGGAKTRSGNAILVNGPQFGFCQPAYTCSIGLHGAGFDVVGTTPFGYPAVLFGHNGHIAWGSTAGMGAAVDLVVLRLSPDDPEQYWHRGELHRMRQRSETIAVRGREPVRVTARSSSHGPVTAIDPTSEVAYARQRAWAGAEVDSLFGWLDSTRAENWSQWRAAAARNAVSINWYYADRAGNIGYVHTGRYPRRAPGVDPRLPISGAGDMEWHGHRAISDNPAVFNPARGFLVNWNNKPVAGYEGQLTWSSADRVRELDDRLHAATDVTPEDAWQLVEDTSFLDLNLRYFRAPLRRAVADLPVDAPEAVAVRWLDDWDGTHRDNDGDGLVDHPGSAILRTWLTHMTTATLADLPTAVRERFAGPDYPESSAGVAMLAVAPSTQLVHHALLGADSGVPQQHDFFAGRDPLAVVLDALTSAVGELRGRFGPDVDTWRLPVLPGTFIPRNFADTPQADPDELLHTPEFANRGTINNMIVLGHDGVTACEVVPPGQSGFVAPDGSTGPHHRDQLDLFTSFRHKPVWSRPDEVAAHAVSFQRLNHVPGTGD